MIDKKTLHYHYLQWLCEKGWGIRNIPERAKKVAEKRGITYEEAIKLYKDQLEKELGLLDRLNFVDYILVVYDLYNWCRNVSNIMPGPGRGCLSGDTNIVMGDGSVKPIECIEHGDTVFTHTGKKRKVIHSFVYDVYEDLVKINTYLGDFKGVTLTKDHKVFAQKVKYTEGWLKCCINQKSKIKKYERPTNEIFEISAGDLEPGDWMFVPYLEETNKIGDKVFDLFDYVLPNNENIICDEKRDLIIEYTRSNTKNDFSVASIWRNTGIPKYFLHQIIKDFQNNSNEVLKTRLRKYLLSKYENIREWLSDLENIRYRKLKIKRYIEKDSAFYWVLGKWVADGWLCTDRDNVWGICCNEGELWQLTFISNWLQKYRIRHRIRHKEAKSIYELNVYSKTFTRWWQSMFPEYKCSSHTKHFPYFLNDICVQDLHGVVDGYIAGDGCYEKNTAKATTVSKQLAYQFRVFLMRLGYPSSLFKNVRYDKENKTKINKFSYDTSYPVKQQNASIRWHKADKGHWVQVKSKEEVSGIKKVYDLSVEFDHSYLTTSGAVHNSSGGSLVCFLTTITAVDPIEHNLLFERFINPNRIDMPDIDMDFEHGRRDEVIQYIYDRYGKENVAQIITISKLKAKSCLKDVARVFEIPFKEVNKVTNTLLERRGGDREFNCIEDSAQEVDAFKSFNEKYPKIVELAGSLEGLSRQAGVHAAGVVASPVPITDVIPIEVYTSDGVKKKVTCLDKDGVGALGLLKLDVLGLETLTVLKGALVKIKERTGVSIDLEELDFNDEKVLKNFSKQNFVGVFQFDSESVKKIFSDIEYSSFDDVVAINALNRPGTIRSGYAETWCLIKQGKKKVKEVHPVVDEITKDTLGVLVYQEQINRIFIELGGYDPGDADSLRKKISKSKGAEELENERVKFIKGAQERGCSIALAGDLMDKIVKFGLYCFNLSHSVEYGAIAYWCMYLKTYYPAEFIWSLLQNEVSLTQIARYVREAKDIGCTVLTPNINTSMKGWSLNPNNQIEASLLDIKGVGEKAVDSILRTRPFSSLSDFIHRSDSFLINKRVYESLAKAKALRDFLPNVKVFLDTAGTMSKMGKEKYCDFYSEMYESEEDFDEDDLDLLATSVCPIVVGRHPLEIYEETFKQFDPSIKFESTEDPDWTEQIGWFRGQITDTRFDKTNDYAYVNIEDLSGVARRVKLEGEVLSKYKKIIDKGYGSCVAILCSKFARNQSLKCVLMVDLEVVRQTLKAKGELYGESKILLKHPIAEFGGHSGKLNKILDKKVSKRGDVARDLVVLIVSVKEHIDKNGNEMAFIDVAGVTGSVGAVCFASSYPSYKKSLKQGVVAKIDLKRGNNKKSWILDHDDHCSVKILSNVF